MSKYWFKPKRVGWGISSPLSWQGWLSLAVFILLILVFAYVDVLFDNTSTIRTYLRFGLEMAVLSFLFCLIVHDKTEGGMKWRWGKTDEE